MLGTAKFCSDPCLCPNFCNASSNQSSNAKPPQQNAKAEKYPLLLYAADSGRSTVIGPLSPVSVSSTPGSGPSLERAEKTGPDPEQKSMMLSA
jgi:hypothetical protein